MRDNTKAILQRQEQTTNSTNRARDKQACDFRKQVEERKTELEKLERKFFAAGKVLVHQESIESTSGDQQFEAEQLDLDPKSQALKKKNAMEGVFRKLMQATGMQASKNKCFCYIFISFFRC
jgi:coiled-coil domain-containing protein 151